MSDKCWGFATWPSEREEPKGEVKKKKNKGKKREVYFALSEKTFVGDQF